MSKHELKVDKDIFPFVQSRLKEYEVRAIEDRTFELGDRLVLKEWDEENQRYTGQAFETGPIRHIQDGGKYGIEKGYVILSWENGRTYNELVNQKNQLNQVIASLQARVQELEKVKEQQEKVEK